MTLEHHGDVAVLRLEAGKANAIDTALLDRLEAGRAAALAGPARALVVTGYERFFCAGLDLVGLSTLDRPAMGAFMRRFNQVMGDLFACPLPVVAAVNGHAIAGGCVLAMCADQRVLVDGGARLGTNEVPLGVGLPPSALEPIRWQLTPAVAFRVLLRGELFEPDEALELGLVQELAPADAVLERAVARAAELGALPGPAFAQAKEALRRPATAAIRGLTDADEAAWLDTWFSPEARANVAAAVARLGGG